MTVAFFFFEVRGLLLGRLERPKLVATVQGKWPRLVSSAMLPRSVFQGSHFLDAQPEATGGVTAPHAQRWQTDCTRSLESLAEHGAHQGGGETA